MSSHRWKAKETPESAEVSIRLDPGKQMKNIKLFSHCSMEMDDVQRENLYYSCIPSPDMIRKYGLSSFLVGKSTFEH